MIQNRCRNSETILTNVKMSKRIQSNSGFQKKPYLKSLLLFKKIIISVLNVSFWINSRNGFIKCNGKQRWSTEILQVSLVLERFRIIFYSMWQTSDLHYFTFSQNTLQVHVDEEGCCLELGTGKFHCLKEILESLRSY